MSVATQEVQAVAEKNEHDALSEKIPDQPAGQVEFFQFIRNTKTTLLQQYQHDRTFHLPTMILECSIDTVGQEAAILLFYQERIGSQPNDIFPGSPNVWRISRLHHQVWRIRKHTPAIGENSEPFRQDPFEVISVYDRLVIAVRKTDHIVTASEFTGKISQLTIADGIVSFRHNKEGLLRFNQNNELIP